MKSQLAVAAAVFGIIVLAATGIQAADSDDMTAREIVTEMHKRFMDQDIKTYTFDEIRVTSQKNPPSKDGTVMPLNQDNAKTMKLRYFYQAPDKHGYKLISEEIENYWVGSPNQAGALPMDHNWKDKILNWYDVSRSEKLREVRGRECFVVTLMPKEGMPSAYPMTWYVDRERFVVLRFIFLVTSGDKKVHTVGNLTYKEVRDGFWAPASAEWRTRVADFPNQFTSSSEFTNYKFDIPLDPSVFEEEFPEGWFESPDHQPYNQAQDTQ